MALAFPMLAPVVLMVPQAAFAQGAPVVARPVVQALPSADSQRLKTALARIGRDPRDAAALVDAADAAKALADYDAAIGFYRRADEVTPNDPHIKAGLAAALAMSGDPVAAIPLFAEAEKAGAAPSQIAADRGLAYDLVGANATAQHYYAMAGSAPNEEVRMRLAISQAIAGDNTAAQTTLMPLLQKQDKPGWRTRAFALAIAGDTQQAVDVSNSILPPQLAQNIAPYLRYMPRLTRAQQAAAANLGRFPRASEIGHDDTRISAYATQLAATEAAMTPRATVAAAQSGAGKAGARGGRKAASTPRTAPPPVVPATVAPAGTPPSAAHAAIASAAMPPRTASGELPPISGAAKSVTTAPASAPPASTAPVKPSVSTPALTAATPPVQSPSIQAPAKQPSSPPSQPTSQPASQPTPAGQGFDLARSPGAVAPPASLPPTAKPPVAEAPPEPSERQLSLSEIFADLGKPAMVDAPSAGAVDIRKIEPARPAPPPPPPKPEVKPEPKSAAAADADDAKAVGKPDAKAGAKPTGTPTGRAGAKGAAAKAEVPEKPTSAKAKKPAPPAQPSRMWVQIGVGRDKDAIAFDWRRNLKQAPTLLKGRQPYVTEMGRTNRILVGPFATQKAVNAFLADAKKQGFDDALPWTSPAGQVVDPLSDK